MGMFYIDNYLQSHGHFPEWNERLYLPKSITLKKLFVGVPGLNYLPAKNLLSQLYNCFTYENVLTLICLFPNTVKYASSNNSLSSFFGT